MARTGVDVLLTYSCLKKALPSPFVACPIFCFHVTSHSHSGTVALPSEGQVRSPGFSYSLSASSLLRFNPTFFLFRFFESHFFVSVTTFLHPFPATFSKIFKSKHIPAICFLPFLGEKPFFKIPKPVNLKLPIMSLMP